MPIKPFKTIDEQYQILLDRGLTIRNKDEFTSYILKNNYFNVINGNEDLLLVNAGQGKKFYDTASFDDFTRLHKFDKTLSNHLIRVLHNFESSLKNSIAKNFAEVYCRTPANTMQYTNKKNYLDINSKSGKQYIFYYDQNSSIVRNFDDFLVFNTSFLRNLIKRYDFIDEKIFSVDSSLYTSPPGCNSYEIKSNSRQVVVPLWVAIETFDFGTLQRFCHYLTTNVMNKVLADFNLESSDRDMFLNSLDVIKELRNNCAHFNLINRFSTSLYIKIAPSLIKKLNLKPTEKSVKVYIPSKSRKVKKNAAKLNLFDTLKVLSLYEDLSILKTPLKNLIYQNNRNFKSNTYDLNRRILERMGNENYSDWKRTFS